jgi:hypothetical protein
MASVNVFQWFQGAAGLAGSPGAIRNTAAAFAAAAQLGPVSPSNYPIGEAVVIASYTRGANTFTNVAGVVIGTVHNPPFTPPAQFRVAIPAVADPVGGVYDVIVVRVADLIGFAP